MPAYSITDLGSLQGRRPVPTASALALPWPAFDGDARGALRRAAAPRGLMLVDRTACLGSYARWQMHSSNRRLAVTSVEGGRKTRRSALRNCE